MADQTIRFPEGIAEEILVKVKDDYVPVDFLILDMGSDDEVPLILGRPFLNTTNAVIYVGSGQIHFQFPAHKVKCAFNGYTNSQVKSIRTEKPSRPPRWVRQKIAQRRLKAEEAKLKKDNNTAEPQHQEWREKEVHTQTPSPRSTTSASDE